MHNRIDKLAGGTVLVADLVEEEKEQTLTHKTIDDATNVVGANVLRTVDWRKEVTGLEPTEGQMLTAIADKLEFKTFNVLAQKLIGFVLASGPIMSTDTILEALEKLSGNANATQEQVDAHSLDIVELYGRANALQTGINQVNVVVTGHTTSITNLETEVDALQEAIGTLPTGTADAVANTLVKRDANASTAVKDQS